MRIYWQDENGGLGYVESSNAAAAQEQVPSGVTLLDESDYEAHLAAEDQAWDDFIAQQAAAAEAQAVVTRARKLSAAQRFLDLGFPREEIAVLVSMPLDDVPQPDDKRVKDNKDHGHKKTKDDD